MKRRNFLKFAAGLPALALIPFAAWAGYKPGDQLTAVSLNALSRECGAIPKFKNGSMLTTGDLNYLAVISGGAPGFKPGILPASDLNRMLPRLYGAANRR